MNFLKIILAIVICGYTFAQEAKSKLEAPQALATHRKDFRSEKTVDLYFGFDLQFSQGGTDLILGYHLPNKDLVEVSRHRFSSEKRKNDDFHGKVLQYYSLFYKRFFGETFYIRGGLSLVEFDDYDKRTNENYYSLSRLDLGPSFGLGNLRHEKYLTYGIEWIRINSRLQNLSYSSEGQLNDKFAAKDATGVDFILLNLRLGVSF